VEKTLDYSFVCHDKASQTTDKVKFFVTSALEEKDGYTLSNNKFKLTKKSAKVKVAYKNGEVKLTAAKGTPDGTQARILIVVTHADKTVEVFESGVITVGTAAADGNN
ncbi:MAG: hypothetical protein J5824_04895, partial [Lachnospiraceae bacterium]|nr:hypothetical protein [Lachnospiraceae bacterium]